jgi:holo-[acyl-carrier protein] synthase
MGWAAQGSALRVGTDILPVDDVRRAIEAFGDRYLTRVFTARELADANRNAHDAAPRLAARFAAKEAVLKTLRPRGWWPDWRDIEIVRDATGCCHVALHGRAASFAAEQDLHVAAVSLSHERDIATATALAATGHAAAQFITSQVGSTHA